MKWRATRTRQLPSSTSRSSTVRTARNAAWRRRDAKRDPRSQHPRRTHLRLVADLELLLQRHAREPLRPGHPALDLASSNDANPATCHRPVRRTMYAQYPRTPSHESRVAASARSARSISLAEVASSKRSGSPCGTGKPATGARNDQPSVSASSSASAARAGRAGRLPSGTSRLPRRPRRRRSRRSGSRGTPEPSPRAAADGWSPA